MAGGSFRSIALLQFLVFDWLLPIKSTPEHTGRFIAFVLMPLLLPLALDLDQFGHIVKDLVFGLTVELDSGGVPLIGLSYTKTTYK